MKEIDTQEAVNNMVISEIDQKPFAYLVAGGGGGMRSTIMLRLIAAELAARDIPYRSIDGVYTDENGGDHVQYPSLQKEKLLHDVKRHGEEKPFLVIAHCIGTIAAVSAVDEFRQQGRLAGLVSVAPPLQTPEDVIHLPQSKAKRSDNDTRMRIIDLPTGATDYTGAKEGSARLDKQYFIDISAASQLEKELRQGVEAGHVAVCASEYDWNEASPSVVRGWQDAWRQEFYSDEATALQDRAMVIPDAAHGLYVSPLSGSGATPEESVAYQQANVRQVVDLGLRALGLTDLTCPDLKQEIV